MKTLVIDRDDLSSQLLITRLKSRGYEVTYEPSKAAALDLIAETDFDIIMLDPLPVHDARPIIISVYKTLKQRPSPQFLLLSKTLTAEDALAAGANDVIQKPISPQGLEDRLNNLEQLIQYKNHLGTKQKMEPITGVLNKGAFNELFLSAIDRAYRYAERSFVVFIELKAPDNAFETLSENIRFIRRQSDIIGRVDAQSYGVLLQRPLYENEPMEAITRFSEELKKRITDLKTTEPLILDLKLIEVPVGTCHAHLSFDGQNFKAVS